MPGIHPVDLIGYAAAIALIFAFATTTMIKLRIAAIAASGAFLIYGFFRPDYILLVLHAVLLPLNIWRLNTLRHLVAEAKKSTEGDMDMGWIKPFTSTRDMSPGEVIFHKGEEAKEIVFVMSGSLRIPTIDVTIPPGEVVGELGMLSPEKLRTASVVCLDAGQILTITYEQVRELFFQNPNFGYFFMQLAARRLFDNQRRLQAEIDKLRRDRDGLLQQLAQATQPFAAHMPAVHPVEP
jgi:CRP/FNR family transcriptional regulator, cyclic AMP receptor protein